MDLIDSIKKTGVSPDELAKSTGIPVSRIYKWFSGKASPKYADALKMEEFLKGRKIKRLEDLEGFEKRPVEPRMQERNEIKESEAPYGQSFSVIEKLAESNRLIAEGNNNGALSVKIIADANKILVETNNELAAMLKVQMNLSALQPLSEAENDSILTHLAEKGTAEGLWPSAADGLAVLGRLLFSYKRKNVPVHR